MTKVVLSEKFFKDLKKLKKKFNKIDRDLDGLFVRISSGEVVGDRLREFRKFEIYKARVRNSSSDVGKSGGFRVIYYLKREDDLVLVLSIYSKSQKLNILKNEILKILKDENLIL